MPSTLNPLGGSPISLYHHTTYRQALPQLMGRGSNLWVKFEGLPRPANRGYPGVGLHPRTRAHGHAHAHAPAHTRAHTHTHVRTHTHTRARTRAHAHARTHARPTSRGTRAHARALLSHALFYHTRGSYSLMAFRPEKFFHWHGKIALQSDLRIWFNCVCRFGKHAPQGKAVNRINKVDTR